MLFLDPCGLQDVAGPQEPVLLIYVSVLHVLVLLKDVSGLNGLALVQEISGPRSLYCS